MGAHSPWDPTSAFRGLTPEFTDTSLGKGGSEARSGLGTQLPAFPQGWESEPPGALASASGEW